MDTMTEAAAYPDYPHRLATIDSPVGTVAVIGYRGRTTLRIWSATQWFDARHPAPDFRLTATTQMLERTDTAAATAWLSQHLGAIIDAEVAADSNLAPSVMRAKAGIA